MKDDVMRHDPLASFLDDFPHGAVRFSPELTVTGVNRAFIAMCGDDASALTGRDRAGFDAFLSERSDPDLPYRPCWSQPAAMTSVFSECSTSRQACQCDFQIIQPQWLRLRRHLHRNPVDGSTVLYFQDVSRESRLDRMMSDFLVTTAHELRTPLTTMLGYAELLVTEDIDPIEANRMQRTLFRHGRHLAAILEDVLDLARLESAQKPPLRNTVDLAQVALLACGEFQPTDERRPRVALPDTDLAVLGDCKQIVRCLHLLLDNAFRYSYGKGDIQVRVTKDPEDGWNLLEVIDEGVGMTPEQASKAFERFWRGDASGKTPGSGLGLPIVREIMRRHGGVAELVSRPAHGTTVRLRFPPVSSTSTLSLKDHTCSPKNS